MIKITLLILLAMLTIVGKAQDTCTMGDLPVIEFKPKNVFLTPKAKILLNNVIVLLKASSGCKLRLLGHMSNPTYTEQQMSWDRVTSVANYLRSNGVTSDRWIFEHGLDGQPLTVDLVAVNMSEEGPSTTPVPLPCYSFHKKGKRCVDKKGNFKGG